MKRIQVSTRKQDCNQKTGESVCVMVGGHKVYGLLSAKVEGQILTLEFCANSFDLLRDEK